MTNSPRGTVHRCTRFCGGCILGKNDFIFPYGSKRLPPLFDIPTGWDPRANQSPTGALVTVLCTAALFDSRTGQIKNALARTATPVDIPTGWDPNTKKEPTGLFFAACGPPCFFDSSYGLHEKIPDPKIRDFIHDPYGNRTHVTAVKGPCLNRLTNGPYKYRASLKPPTSIVHYCGRPSPLS